jgi:hypothetical protein
MEGADAAAGRSQRILELKVRPARHCAWPTTSHTHKHTTLPAHAMNNNIASARIATLTFYT